MIAFFVVTILLNLALGYALALYLKAGVAQRPCEICGAQVGAETEEWERLVAIPASASTTLPAPAEACAGDGGAAMEAPAISSLTTPVAELTQSATDVEKDLLAGIEEFRNQLAQLKGNVPLSDALDPVESSQPNGG